MIYSDLFDLHTHSVHSFDGNHSVEKMCKSAIEKGITAITITDHCDIDGEGTDFNLLFEKQFADIAACREKLSDKLKIYSGIELGQGIYRKAEAEALLNKFSFDFVLGSIHNIENKQDYYFIDYNNADVYELLDEYIDAITQLCEWGNFDSLAHLTYPLRYIEGKYKIDVDLSRFSAKIDNILKLLINNEKALEINTSEISRELADFMPAAKVVSRYRELGGKYITLGSDSHFAERIGSGIEQGLKMAQDCGFEYQTVFVERKPKLIKIK